MLTIQIVNDGTGDDKIGYYDVTVSANGEMIDQTRIEGHERAQDWRWLIGHLVYGYRQSELEQELNALFQEIGPTCTEAIEGVRLMQKLLHAQQEDIARYRQWVDDLQAGMYVNCVYCGHRYGPDDEIPVSMAQALKEHVERCPEHPMSKLKAELEEEQARNDLFSRCMHRGLKLWREAHPDKPNMWPDGAKNICWLLDELEDARCQAVEEYRIFICPKCGAEFEDPDPNKEYPSGIVCSECPGDLKGVIHPRIVKRFITQGNWDQMLLDRMLYVDEIEELRENVDLLLGQLAEIAGIVGVDMEEMADDSEIVQAVRERCCRSEKDSASRLQYYVYAGKLGPWARNGCKGTRYLALGMQGHEDLVQIERAEKESTWHYVKVFTVEGGIISHQWCGTNTYMKAGDDEG